MTHLVKLLTLSALMALGAAQAKADQTNLVQDLNIQLSGLKQGGTTTNRNLVVTSVDATTLGTRQVINALGAATGNTFSSGARLVVVTPLDGGVTWFQVRDGATVADVSAFFTYEQSGSVSSSQVNLKTGRASGSEYSIQHLALSDPGYYKPLTLRFDLRGAAVSTSSSSAAFYNETAIDASGTGDRNGNLLILQGAIRIRGNTLEVVSAGPVS